SQGLVSNSASSAKAEILSPKEQGMPFSHLDGTLEDENERRHSASPIETQANLEDSSTHSIPQVDENDAHQDDNDAHQDDNDNLYFIPARSKYKRRKSDTEVRIIYSSGSPSIQDISSESEVSEVDLI